MAQYDLHLTQNTHVSAVEFSEKLVNIAKGGILSANSSQVPTVLPPGNDGYMLVRDDAEATGLKWQAVSGGHTQNTDTGTTASIFSLDSDGFDVELKAEDANTLGLRTSGDVAYADLKIDALTLGAGSAVDTVETTITDDDTHIPTSGAVKDYADALLGANDAMTYKGVQDCSTNPNYPAADAGDTYKVSVAGKIGGASGIDVEVGDMLICTSDSTASGDHATVGASWNVIQRNEDGLVSGTASSTDGYLVLFDGTTGKLIKEGTGAPGTMAYETAANYVTKALFDANTILAANTDNVPAALIVAEQTFVGRKTGGNVAGLTALEAINILWSAAPAAKTSTGSAGQIAKDDNYFYICTATDTWKRSPIATNWT